MLGEKRPSNARRRSSVIPRRKKRPGTRRGQPTPEEKGRLRGILYRNCGGRCEFGFEDCIAGILPLDGDLRERFHLVHMRSKRRFGWPLEGEYRMRGGCFNCHRRLHNEGHKQAFINDERRRCERNGKDRAE